MSTETRLDIKALAANQNIAARNYWRTRLEGFEFNACFDDGQNGTSRRSNVLILPPAGAAVQEALHDIAASDKAKHIVLLSVLGILAHKCSSLEDLAILTPVYEGNENNVVPVRMNRFADISFTEFLSSVKDDALRDIRSGNYPFDKIMNQLGAQPDKSLLTGMMVAGLHDASSFDVWQPGLLFTFSIDGQLTLEIGYDTLRYDTLYIEQLGRLYFNLLAKLVENRKLDIRSIELIPAEEKEKILHVFNDTDAPFPSHRTIMDLFHEQAAKTPQNIAIRFHGDQLTYAELVARSNQLAHFLIASGAKKGDIVAVQLDRSLELMIAIFGILKAGCVYLPLTKDYPSERVRYVLDNSRAAFVFTNDPTDACRCLSVEDAFTYPTDDINFAKPDNLAYIIYTSGSTGNPKGVMIRHVSVVNRLNWMQNQYRLNEHDIILQKTPVVFDVSVWELFWWSFTGASLVLASPGAEKDPAALCNIITNEKITVLHFVPTMLNALVNYVKESKPACSFDSIRHAFASGEELNAGYAQQFLGFCTRAELHNLYGPTEATVDVSYHAVSRSASYRRVPIGKPIDNTQLLVFNKDLQLQPVGIAGELLIGGINLAAGYLNQPELTREKFISNPLDPNTSLYRTGDLARWLPDGSIEFLGRIDNQVKIRGNRIEIGEIEHAIKSFNGIKDVVVLTKESNGGLQLVAYVVSHAEPDEEALRAFLNQRLPDYMIPAYFIPIDAVPVTVNGKADRRKLLSMKVRSAAAYTAPATELERILQEQWQIILDHKQVSVTDSFFRIGGDSILAVRLIGAINNELPVHISMIDVYEHDTIRELARFIEQSGYNNREDDYQLIEAELDVFDRNYRTKAGNDNIEAVYPMSDIEKSMCFSHKYRPEDLLYFEQIMQPVAYEKLDINLLQQALNLLVRKHEILRTGFDISEFAHIIYKNVQHNIIFHDLSGLSPDEQKSLIMTNLEDSRRRHFDLASVPLWRIVVYRLKDSHHEVLFEYHHAIFDGWSIASLIKELNETYIRLLHGREATVEPLASSYRDFIMEEMYHKQSEETRAYWRNELKGYRKLKFNSGLREKTYRSVRETYPATLVSELEEAARQRKTTVKNILMAAYVYAMKILTGEHDLLVGIVTFTRPLKKDGDKILGCFLNTVPFRIRVPEHVNWLEYVNLIHNKMLEVKKYDNLSLFEINQSVGGSAMDGNPFFDTFFNYISWHVLRNMELEKLSEESLDRVAFDSFVRANTFFDANYNVNDQRILTMHEYSSPFMSEETLKHYTSIFDHALHKIIHSPEEKLDPQEIFWQDKEKPVHAMLAYWKKQLGYGSKSIELPADHAATAYSEGVKQVTVPADLLKKVEEHAPATGVSPRTVLMAAFNLVLHRYTQQDEVTICTNAGQHLIPVSTVFHPQQQCAEFLTGLHTAYSKATQYSGITMDVLKEELGFSCNVSFIYGGEVSASSGDLELVLEKDGKGRLLFNAAMFHVATIDRFWEHYLYGLRLLLSMDNIGSVDVIGSRERQYLLHGMNQTMMEFPLHDTIISLFDKQVESAPDNIAIRFGDGRATYSELQLTSVKVAAWLQSKGVRPKHLVGVMLEREEYLLPVILGILRAGAAYVPIDPFYPADRINSILQDAGLKTLVSRSRYLDASIIANDIINLDEDAPAINEQQHCNAVEMQAEDPAYVIYTSGSTGKPKGVVVTHRSVINSIWWMQQHFNLLQDDVLLLKTPIAFDVSVWELFGWAFTGSSLCMLKPGEEKQPELIAATVAEHKVTYIHFVPSMLSGFLSALDEHSIPLLSSLRRVLCSGEALKPAHVNHFAEIIHKHCGTKLINLYGPTETTVHVSYYDCPLDAPCTQVPIGKPVGNTRWYVLDKWGRPSPVGVPGELCIAGIPLAKGYLNNESLTQQKFTQHPLLENERIYRTGDKVRLLPDGNIEYLGRIDEQVKIRGYRVELGEIESTLVSYPGISEVAAVVKEKDDDKYLVAYYVSPTALKASALRNHLSGKLPAYMVPAYFVHLPYLPLNANGKLDRKALPDPDLHAGEKYEAPANEIEEKLVEIWSAVLKIDKQQISVNRSFFELGGHSLKATTLANKIEKGLNTAISIKEIFDKPTIRQQGELVKIAEWLSNQSENTGKVEVII
ncbi:MAG TPA: amino acid adenylation domain-containing protein [Chitinophagaceae bacterium]|nr:amino acid adenylation domain-containing protein [Chitinophagaceae bacterium]